MRSLLLEFLRLNNLATGIWREGDPYLVAAGSEYPIRQFTSPLEHEKFLDLIRALRYQDDAEARTAALKEIGETAAQLLNTDSLTALSSGSFPLQLDLVVNPAEVAALPFEAATDSEGNPLFARADPEVVLTRRVRHAFAEASVRWPAKPRLLYAWAAPPRAGDVPSAAHEAALRKALGPWMPAQQGAAGTPGADGVLTALPEATLARLEEACRTAVEENKPFTHVHLLVHGYPIGQAHKQLFGMALHSEDGDLHAVTPEEIEKALAPLVGHTVVVTLATCDAANLTNTITSRRSIAHGLHELGFPVVVASQFPFTVPGSNLMVETFYQALLDGQDVRIALHRARAALYANRQTTGHDWASLVGYVRLPEGYADHLLDIRLESVLASLKTTQGWSDRLMNQDGKDAAIFERVATELQDRIRALLEFLGDSEKTSRRGVFEENVGLLGSAEKRLAEVCFARSRLGEGAHWQQLMREALQRSREWYRQAYRQNLSHHWTGVQQLSLEAVLDGRIANPGHWHAAVAAADIDKAKPKPGDVIWALGSLAELRLLAPLAGQNLPVDSAKDALTQMKALVLAQPGGDTFPLESTKRQFRRYVDWWTSANGFFPRATDLADEAGTLVRQLDLNIIRPSNAQAAVADIRKSGRRILTFLGFSGSGYEDYAGLRRTIEGVLAPLDPAAVLVNAGGTTDGIGVVYSIAKARGFSTAGIVSARAEKEKAELSPDADSIYIIADDTWGGLLPDGNLSPTSLAMVEASDEMVAIGGDAIARDELSAQRSRNKSWGYIPADMNHDAARQKARKNGRPEPHEFRGAAYEVFGAA